MSRRIFRVAGTATAVSLALATAGCTTTKEPGQSYPSLGAGMTILIFVVVPLGIFGVVALFAALPGILKRPRYRPGRPWDHDPLWFAGPDDPDEAIVRARSGPTAKGGASAEW